jgi:hypothetical protein
MNYKLIIDHDINLSSLKEKVETGGRFVVFSYCIGLGAIALKRMSPAILIENEAQLHYYRKRYNRINYIFGWWAIPYGLMLTPNYIIANNKGGVDVTEDILLNITEASLKEKQIEFRKTTMLFDFPDKSDEKIFRKHFAGIMADTYEIKRLVVGWYLNVENGTAPFYLIGIDASDYYEKYIENLKKRLYTDFFKRVHFEFIDISDNEDIIKDVFLMERLLKQGLVINKEKI